MISHAIQNAFKKGRQRGWDHVYFAFDIHDTILKANYSNTEISTEIYDTARHVLEYISGREDIIMIIYTCSHPHELKQYLEYFENIGIKFKFSNENPMVLTNNQGYGNYDKKMYFDVFFEDKAGFVPETDWYLAHEALIKEPLLTDKSLYSIESIVVSDDQTVISQLISCHLPYQEAKDTIEKYNTEREDWYQIIKE